MGNLEGKLRQRKIIIIIIIFLIFIMWGIFGVRKTGVCQNSKIDICPGQHNGHSAVVSIKNSSRRKQRRTQECRFGH